MADKHELYTVLTATQRAKLRASIQGKARTHGECRVVPDAVHAGAGRRCIYKQTRVPGVPSERNLKVYMHKFMAMENMGRAPVGDEEGSHLCGNPACVRLEHLVLESGDVNKTRDCCRMFLGVHPLYICPHDPVCIRPVSVAAAAAAAASPVVLVSVDLTDDDDDFE